MEVIFLNFPDISHDFIGVKLLNEQILRNNVKFHKNM